MASEELERLSEMKWQKSFGVGGMWDGLDKDGKTTKTLNFKRTGIIPEPWLCSWLWWRNVYSKAIGVFCVLFLSQFIAYFCRTLGILYLMGPDCGILGCDIGQTYRLDDTVPEKYLQGWSQFGDVGIRLINCLTQIYLQNL